MVLDFLESTVKKEKYYLNKYVDFDAKSKNMTHHIYFNDVEVARVDSSNTHHIIEIKFNQIL